MNNDRSDRIEKYLLGKMTDEERASFENELKGDHKLSAETKQMMQRIKREKKEFSQDLDSEFHKENKKINSASDRKTTRTGVITGIVAVMSLVAVIYLYNFLPNPDLKHIYATYFRPYPVVSEQITPLKAINEAAFSFYESEDYSRALGEFQKILKSGSEDASILLYAGISSLQLNQAESAIRYFSQILDSPESPFTRPAIWYTALAYFYVGEIKNAVSYLQMLLKDDDQYSSDAKEILRKFR